MLIAMAIWDTVENNRTEMTRRTLESLSSTVDWSKHRLIVSDNGSCQNTRDMLIRMRHGIPFLVIQNGENIGTARAINRCWSYRKPKEHVVKMDNDVVINHNGWADELEEVFSREPSIGICGLKRKDLDERPDHPHSHYKSVLGMLPHQPGQSWIVVEECNHIMGTCQAYNSDLIEKMGYLFQGDWKYGFDDSIASLRAHILGFRTVFLPHVNIDHIDPGGTPYQKWKEDLAGAMMGRFGEIVVEYKTGKRLPFYDGGEDSKWAESHQE